MAELIDSSNAAPDFNDREFPLARICAAWESKIKLAEQARKGWKEVADECMRFYSESHDFLWDSRYPDQLKLWSGKLAPKFRMTINKAFEFVSLYGPVIYARNPYRSVTPRDTVKKVAPKMLELMGLPGGQLPPPPQPGQLDPNTGMPMQEPPEMQAIRQVMDQLSKREARGAIQAHLMELWSNYCMGEGPGQGGFEMQAELAATEAMLKGRGLVWPEPYHPPGSDRVLITSAHDDTYNMFFDPDATKPSEAQFYVRKCVHPNWQVEREYKLEPGTLAGNMESFDAQARTEGDDLKNVHRATGQTNDLVVYYKIYSKMGLGGRLHGLDGGVRRSLEALGDYCFLVVAPGVPYPLNLPPKAANRSVKHVKELVKWPTPFWRDGRAPFASLDFYHRLGSCYPIPPLSPGLGELKFMTLMMSHLTNRVWSSCRNIVVVMQQVEQDLKRALESGADLEIVGVSYNAQIKELAAMIQFLEFPEVNLDVWKMLEASAINFDKRVGLTELMYGMSSHQMRSAHESAVKEDRISVRPEYMSNKVEKFLKDVARMEAMATRWHVEGDDVIHVLGELGGQMWNSHITSTPVEEVAFELDYSIEPGSARKRNKEQELTNIQELIQVVAPVLVKYAEVTTDTQPFNKLVQSFGEAMNRKDIEQFDMGPMQPPPAQGPSPEEQKLQLEREKAEMQMQLKDKEFGLKIEDAKLEAEKAQQEMAMEMQKFEMEMQMKREEHQFDMAMTQQQAAVDMQVQQTQAAADIQVSQTQAAAQMQTQQAMADQKMQLGEQQGEQKAEQHKAAMAQSKQEAQLGLQQKKAEGDTKLQLAKKAGDVKLETTKKQSDAKVQATKAQAKAKDAAKPKPKKKKPKK